MKDARNAPVGVYSLGNSLVVYRSRSVVFPTFGERDQSMFTIPSDHEDHKRGRAYGALSSEHEFAVGQHVGVRRGAEQMTPP